MILGIDASNIRMGGGLTHLVELLNSAEPAVKRFKKVIVWGASHTLSELPKRDWLELVHVNQLDRKLISRIYWQHLVLPKLAANSCDVLFVPGGSYSRNSTPVVTMSQNLLPFESKEVFRFGLSWVLIRLFILRFTQGRSFKKANGVIFLTKYAQNAVRNVIGDFMGRQAIIPHGINQEFYSSPKPQFNIKEYSFDQSFKFLYVSTVDMYKHQWQVVEAVANLRKEGLPIELDLIGPAYPRALKKLQKALDQFDPESKFIHYHGPIPYRDLAKNTCQADGVIFASTCENLPIILLEAMASGVPIACSNSGPMPEILKDAGMYFDPENIESLYLALKMLLQDESLREKVANLSYEYALEFSWHRCAKDTFNFLFSIAQSGHAVSDTTFTNSKIRKAI